MFDVAQRHTLQSLIDERAERASDRVFFLAPETGREVSYGALRDGVRDAGAHIAAVPKGGTVGVLAGNGWAAVQLLLAIPYHGRRALMLNGIAGPAGVVYALRHSKCRLVFADEDNAGFLRDLARSEGLDTQIETISRDEGISGGHEPPPPVSADGDALLIYTSGTTGNPKGCCTRTRACCTAARSPRRRTVSARTIGRFVSCRCATSTRSASR